MSRRPVLLALSVTALSAAAGVAWVVAAFGGSGGSLVASAGVVRVVDGDTLALPAARVRLADIDAPEMGQKCREGEKVVACGVVAKDFLAGLVAGGEKVVCSPEGLDRHRRVLARCRGGAEREDLGRAMVRAGWALRYPDADAYMLEEWTAWLRGRGMHAMEYQHPQDWRRNR